VIGEAVPGRRKRKVMRKAISADGGTTLQFYAVLLAFVCLFGAIGCASNSKDVEISRLRSGQYLLVNPDVKPGSIHLVKVYAIEKADSFPAIAKRFNQSVENLQRLNPEVNPKRLFIGQKIRVSEESIE
jgi:hypothetical protein